MTATTFPTDANCTVEEAVLKGESAFDDEHFEYVGQAGHPNSVLYASLNALEERLNGDGPEVEAVNVGDAGDLDGGTATALLRHKFGVDDAPCFESEEELMDALFNAEYAGGLVALPASHRDYYPDPAEVLEKALDVLEEQNATDIPVYFTDLGPNESNLDEYVELFERENPVLVRDHHNTFDEAMEAADEYVHDDSKCAAEIVLETDHPEAPEHLCDLVEVARVRDLWLDDHPRFAEYAVYGDAHFGLGDAAFERLAAAHGANIVDVPGVGDELRAQAGVKEAKIAYAVENARFAEIGDVTLAVAMGQVYTSEVGRRLYSGEADETADIAIIVKPSGDVSVRTPDRFPHAFDVANALGGGGHDCAAGFGTDAPAGASLEETAMFAADDVTRVLREEVGV